MKEILFGMAVGGVLGILLYKNNSCTREAFDKGEKMIKKELEKMEKPNNKKSVSKN